MKSYDVTFQMKALCLYLHIVLFVFQNFKMKFGNLVEICFWLNLAVKGLIITLTKLVIYKVLFFKSKYKKFQVFLLAAKKKSFKRVRDGAYCPIT